MKQIFPILLLAVAGAATAQNRSIVFEHDISPQLLTLAKQQNKLVFIDCYTVWCGPCQQMAKYVFTQDSVADFFNAGFINVKLDMEKEGKDKAGKYQVEAYPSFLLLDGDGNLVYKFVGGMPSSEFMAKIRSGMDPKNKVALYNRMYTEGNRSKDLLREYVKMKLVMMEIKEGKQVAATYFDMLSPEERVKPENWYLFGDNRYTLYLSNIGDRNSDYLADNWKAFAMENGKGTVEAKMTKTFRKLANYCLEGYYFKEHPYNAAEFDRYRQQISGTELLDKDQLIILMNVAEAAGQKDTVKVTTLLASHIAQLSAENQKIFLSYLTFIRFSPQHYPGAEEVVDQIIRVSKNDSIKQLAESVKKKDTRS
jgi:thiol-disulfide isomerase/thioredoxin